MTVIGIDDTDSRDEGMCTTYVATRIAEKLVDAGASVERRLLIRLNPAVERKTRGNAALAIHTDSDPDAAFSIAEETIADLTAVDHRTSPGLVVADVAPAEVPQRVVEFSRAALREIHSLHAAIRLAEEHGWRHAAITSETSAGDAEGYGRIGALAAIGAWNAIDEWTYELLAYRELERCGTPRTVDVESVFEAADLEYPDVWDTVDRVETEPVCIPNAPGPILYGIRGDDPDACRTVADHIVSETVDRVAIFQTNQGTDAHVQTGEIGALDANAGYRVDGIVIREPETRRGGHTFFELSHPDDVTVEAPTVEPDRRPRTIDCVAFEPTKRFRRYIRSLRPGDEITVCGEFDSGTMKLEKFAIRELVTTVATTPRCPECDRTMESAGAEQGYRCRRCGTATDGKQHQEIERSLDVGWYEVPPCARRHVAKPLVRGGFDAPTHPER